MNADDGQKRTSFEVVANTVDFLGEGKKKDEPTEVAPAEGSEEPF